MNSKGLVLFLVVAVIAALLLGLFALMAAMDARQLALSVIVVEEVNSLSTPVLDEESGAYSFLAMYDVSIANMSGPPVILTSIEKGKTGGGFLSLLRGEEVVTAKVDEKAFVSSDGVTTIKANPKLLKTLMHSDMGQRQEINLALEAGETRVIHIGVMVQPFDEAGNIAANVALVSWQLNFDNGKTYIFRRGFPIYPIQK